MSVSILCVCSTCLSGLCLSEPYLFQPRLSGPRLCGSCLTNIIRRPSLRIRSASPLTTQTRSVRISRELCRAMCVSQSICLRLYLWPFSPVSPSPCLHSVCLSSMCFRSTSFGYQTNSFMHALADPSFQKEGSAAEA